MMMELEIVPLASPGHARAQVQGYINSNTCVTGSQGVVKAALLLQTHGLPRERMLSSPTRPLHA